MSKMIAVLEVEFETDDMWDEQRLKDEMGGDWLKAMQWLFDNESLGIFNEELRLVAVKSKEITNDK